MNLVDKIIQFEMGEMTDKEIIELFAELVKTGQAWMLQGSYGRLARRLIETGYIDRRGNVIRYRHALKKVKK
jgi:hypothetical protein